MGERLKVLMVASEAVPFAKTGGLADVIGALPGALAGLGVDVRVLLPYYGMAKQGKTPMTCAAENLQGRMGGQPLAFNLMVAKSGEVPFYFIERDEFFERSQLYGKPGGDYFDNLERFSFFSSTVLPFCQALAFHPDVIHVHDWQAALVPVYLTHLWQDAPAVANAKTLITIHNLAYQGLFGKDKFPLLGLDWSVFGMDGLEYYDQINLLKGGLVSSHAINTVSRTYSQEIQTPEFGYGLDGVLRSRAESLFGIVNGVDYEVWSPEKDTLIPATFSATKLKGKAENKRALMAAYKLDPALESQPILGVVSRLADQKGFDLIAQVLPELMTRKIPLVILGTGEQKYHDWLADEAKKYPGILGVMIGFDNALAHLIEAGADMFLMPSAYEPCGLNQMYSLKYGTVPIVRATGGLVDTVAPVDAAKGTGTGYLFSEKSAEAFIKVINAAVEAFKDKKLWQKIMKNGMAQDWSWTTSAKTYLNLYQKLVAGEV